MLLHSAELTHALQKFDFRKRNSELTKIFGARGRIPLRRLSGGGQSARSSLHVIGRRHTVEWGSLKLAYYTLCYFANPMIWFGK